MNHKSRGVRVFALSFLAVAGLMAFMAIGAQASEKAWLLLGVDIPSNQLVEVSKHVEGNLEVEKETNLEILCAVIEGEDLLLLKGTTEALGNLKFKTCKTWQGGKESPNCKPVEPITAGGKALLILHNGAEYVLFEVDPPATSFAQIKFKSPCALPETNNVKGSLVAECAHLKEGVILGETCLTERVLHLLREATNASTLFPTDGLLYGTKTAKLLGSVSVVLANGEPWCGHV